MPTHSAELVINSLIRHALARLCRGKIRLKGDGAVVGLNEVNAHIALPQQLGPGIGTTVYRWYAGRVVLNRRGQADEELVFRKFDRPVVGGLTSYGDVIAHGSHGLIGALVVEPEGTEIYAPEDFYQDTLGQPHGRRVPYAEAGGLSVVLWNARERALVREFVVMYQDGLNLHHRGRPVPDCRICDDSYDLGEKGINYRSAAFWARLGLTPAADAEGRDRNNLDEVVFPNNFFDPGYRPLPFADFQAKAGDAMRFLVLQPSGRARQRSFQVYGHTFHDDIYRYGSPWSRLVTPGKGLVLDIPKARAGVWLLRDGPAHIFSGGSWGRLVVDRR